MRPIKFRAWHKQEKNMYEVIGLRLGVRHGMYPNSRVNYVDLCDKSQVFIEGEEVELMQFIGLKDKNGKEIYEEDIIRYGYLALNDVSKFGEEPWKHLPGGVKENDITTALVTVVVKGDIDSLYKLRKLLASNPDVTNGEVIGNIYENPERGPEAKQQ